MLKKTFILQLSTHCTHYSLIALNISTNSTIPHLFCTLTCVSCPGCLMWLANCFATYDLEAWCCSETTAATTWPSCASRRASASQTTSTYEAMVPGSTSLHKVTKIAVAGDWLIFGQSTAFMPQMR